MHTLKPIIGTTIIITSKNNKDVVSILSEYLAMGIKLRFSRGQNWFYFAGRGANTVLPSFVKDILICMNKKMLRYSYQNKNKNKRREKKKLFYGTHNYKCI